MIHKLREITKEQLLFVSVIGCNSSYKFFAIIVKLFDFGAGEHSYHIDSEPR